MGRPEGESARRKSLRTAVLGGRGCSRFPWSTLLSYFSSQDDGTLPRQNPLLRSLDENSVCRRLEDAAAAGLFVPFLVPFLLFAPAYPVDQEVWTKDVKTFLIIERIEIAYSGAPKCRCAVLSG